MFANHKHESIPAAKVFTAFSAVALVFIFSLLAGGCKTKALTDPIIGPDFSATNVYRRAAVLPQNLRRVAVFPLVYDQQDPSAVAGAQILEPVIHTELSKAGRFELVYLSPAEMKQWTGRDSWDDFEALPADLLKKVSEKTGSQGVLFIRLSQFHAYPPILIGWRMKLAATDGGILWAVDEMFDAADEGVSNAARRFDRARVSTNPALEDSRSILLSPSKFGQYTVKTCLRTLPVR